MTREEAIKTIEQLFPADAEWEDTAEIGRRLLERAEREANNWRFQTTTVLLRYAELCIEENHEQLKVIVAKAEKDQVIMDDAISHIGDYE